MATLSLLDQPLVRPVLKPPAPPTTVAAPKPTAPAATPLSTLVSAPGMPTAPAAPTTTPVLKGSPLEQAAAKPAPTPTVPPAAAPPVPTAASPAAYGLGDAAQMPVLRAASPSTPAIGGTRPPEPAPAKPPASGGDFVTDFGPGDDLRFSQVNPLATARLRQLQGQTDTAAGAVGQGPNLTQSALDRLAELDQATTEQRRVGIQDIGRGNAALGRLGSGMVTSQLGDLEALLQARGTAARKSLAGDIATQEAADRRANAATSAGIEGQVAGQEAGARGEVRGERGYQADTAQQALDNRIRQRALEESLTQGAYGRQLGAAELGLQGATLQGNLAQGEQEAAAGGLSDLALQESLKRYSQPAGTVAAPGAPTSTAPITTAPGGYAGEAPPGYVWQNGRLVRVGNQ